MFPKPQDLKSVSIVVPIYKPILTTEEKGSLRQLINVLGHYPVVFVTYKELEVGEYLTICGNRKVAFSYFDKHYFEGVWGYNTLLISKRFYTRFLSSEYILIYQLDAWVFRDELMYWCSKNFDFIGAPLYEGFGKAAGSSHFYGIGNGGLSLRKVRSYLKVLNSFSFNRTFKELKEKNQIDKTTLKKHVELLWNYLTKNNTFFLFNHYDYNEDTYWGELIPRKFKWFKVPDELTASLFSMEVNAPTLYKANRNILPFGCHAWEKYHREFWEAFIQLN